MESQTQKLFSTAELIDPPVEHQLMIEVIEESSPLTIGEISLVEAVQVVQVH